jgi:hypothetical protein
MAIPAPPLLVFASFPRFNSTSSIQSLRRGLGYVEYNIPFLSLVSGAITARFFKITAAPTVYHY